MAGCCEYGNEPSISVKFGEFLGYLRIGYLLKKASCFTEQVSSGEEDGRPER
jgi:hypothetical protein